MANLKDADFIEFDTTSTGKLATRTIRLKKIQPIRQVPVLGRVAAGQPLLANGDDIIEFVPLLARHIREMEAYMLEVHGDSMIGDGIFDGDYVIVVHDDQKPRENEIAAPARLG